MNIEQYIVEQFFKKQMNSKNIHPSLITGNGSDQITYSPPKFISTPKGLVLIGSHFENTK